MGALTLTNLIPSIQAAMDVVSREQVGFIRAVSQDSTAERAAKNQTVYSPIVGALAAEELNVGAYAADTPSETIGSVGMTISKTRSVPFGITGEETKGLQNAGTLGGINTQRISQALRTLTNEVETDLAALHIYASRAYGTATGTPFNTASDFSDFAAANRILDENGAPLSDRHLVNGSANTARIRGKQAGLFEVYRAGTDDLLRRGVLGDVEGLGLHQSQAVPTLVTAGTNNGSATTTAAGFAIGVTNIATAAAGTGTIIAGDIITFAGDTNEYVVVTGVANVASADTTLVIAEPGLRKAIVGATAITTVAATTRNMFFHRSAIQLATRAPAMPEGGDCADDVMMITDPVSGITYEFCLYRQKRQIRYECNLAWGVKMIAPRHCGLLIGA